MADLETSLRERISSGGRAFVPYVTGGSPGVDAGLLRGLEEAGADAVEIGIPFSDPVMDGGVIQEASRVALEAGTRPGDVLATVKEANLGIPVAVMTYLNPILRHGEGEFLAEAAAAGVSGAIVPDLPIDEAAEWISLCARERVAALRPVTDRPLLVGVGIGSPEQAAEACRFADGVIVGSAIVRRLIRGDRDGALVLARAFRSRIAP
jgi:tryptophan synthase alpha chain